jgi:hypothetical protein
MYYKGTKEECEAYNTKVTLGEKYPNGTNRYAYIKKHKNGIDFAILKHDNYESYMEQIENLDNWFNNTEL